MYYYINIQIIDGNTYIEGLSCVVSSIILPNVMSRWSISLHSQVYLQHTKKVLISLSLSRSMVTKYRRKRKNAKNPAEAEIYRIGNCQSVLGIKALYTDIRNTGRDTLGRRLASYITYIYFSGYYIYIYMYIV